MIKGLGEDVSRHVIGSTMIKNNSAFVISLADIVVVDCDVFGSRMESSILDKLNGGLELHHAFRRTRRDHKIIR